MTKEPFVLCGELILYHQSSDRFWRDAFEVDGKDLDDLILAHFGVEVKGAFGCIGEVRITIEPLTEINRDIWPGVEDGVWRGVENAWPKA